MPPIDANRLSRAIELSGLSAREVAHRAGVTEAYISQLRSGARNAERSPEVRGRIADVLGVPVDWIEERKS